MPALDNTVVYGIAGVQGSALQFLEMIAQQPRPQEMLFACPEGLDMLTRDKRFIPQFFDALMKMFATGHRLSVVVRTDYKITDISAFSGPWLVAHLLGYIQSYYYDDFVNTSRDKMLAVVPGMMAGRASENEDGRLYTAIRFDEDTVQKTYAEIKQYQAKCKQRFHYHLFEQPDGFLRGATPLPERMHYQFSRLPHFGLADAKTTRQGFGIGGEEAEWLQQDFGLLTLPVEFYNAQTPVRHLYCEEDIEAALLKSRHSCPVLTAILGRRVVMTTQTLVDRLARMKQLLETHRNFEACFLPEEHFQKIRMQIMAWGDVAAIGWIAGGKSTACRDYTNVNALAGFCEGVWGQIPGVIKSRRAAIRKLNTWLKKAEKYGYSVPPC